MPDRTEEPSGPLDVPTLEVLAQRGTSHPLVSRWTFRPDSISPRVLELEVDVTQYPNPVTEVRIDIRWFSGGDYTIHYLETHEGVEDSWQCRWDRHPKPDAPRTHFHHRPTLYRRSNHRHWTRPTTSRFRSTSSSGLASVSQRYTTGENG